MAQEENIWECNMKTTRYADSITILTMCKVLQFMLHKLVYAEKNYGWNKYWEIQSNENIMKEENVLFITWVV